MFASPGHSPAGGVDEEVCELPGDVCQRQQPQLVHRHRPQPHAAESYSIVHKACHLTKASAQESSSVQYASLALQNWQLLYDHFGYLFVYLR